MSQKQKTPRQTMRYAVDTDRRVSDVRRCMFGWAQTTANVNEFLVECLRQEQWVKSINAGDARVETIPPCWMQAKSDIKRSWEQGFIPKDFETASQHKQAKIQNGKGADVKPERERKPEPGVAQLINDGVLVDAKSKLPDDLRHIERLIRPLNQLSRARVIKSMTDKARQARQDHDGNVYQGQRRAANDPRNKVRPGGLFPGLKQTG